MGTKSKAKRKLRLVKAGPKLLKLDLACGQKVEDGFEGVDLFAEQAKWNVDLLKFPWPWPDNSVGEARCSHFIEHIPMVYVHNGSWSPWPHEGKELFFRFFEELYRVMHKEGSAKIIWPAHKSDRAFQDPTHRRFVPQQALAYLNKAWREDQKLTHGAYDIKCNFVGDIVHSCPTDLLALAPEVQARRFNESWNTIFDFIATLKPIKE